jgi:RNA polymerase sigma-70 factor (ECF subfamily)
MNEKERMIALVKQAKLGDAHSFAMLYEMIYQDLYRTALYILKNPEDAENVVSDTVMDAYAGLGRLRDDSAFRGWIFRILDNKCNRILREYVKRREMETDVPLETVASTTGTFDYMMQNVEDKDLVRDAFSVLTEEEKRIVTLTVYGEYDSSEVAGIMGLNRNTVRSKYSRALAKMRRRLFNE